MRVAAPMVEPVAMMALKASSCLRFTMPIPLVLQRCPPAKNQLSHSLMRFSHNVVDALSSR
ncbi:hypothetical protein D3C84_328090 [compost metagenome]